MREDDATAGRWILVPTKASSVFLGSPQPPEPARRQEHLAALRSERLKLGAVDDLARWLREGEEAGVVTPLGRRGALATVGLTAAAMTTEDAQRAAAEVSDLRVVRDRWVPRISVGSLLGAPTDAPASRWHLDRLGVADAHAKGVRGASATIAVFDSGVDPSHPELAGRVESFEMHGGTVAAVPGRDAAQHGHGTHVAALAAGSTVGAAPDAQVVSLQVIEDDATLLSELVTEWIFWLVDRGDVDVANLSLGLPRNEFDEADVAALDAAVEALWLGGVLPVVAAGNDGVDQVRIPGALPKVLSVGAMADGPPAPRMWNSSSSGLLQGPGSLISLPRCVAPGVAVWSAVPNAQYRAFTGTSQAAPLVAGLAALLHDEAGGQLSPAALFDALLVRSKTLQGVPPARQGAGAPVFSLP